VEAVLSLLLVAVALGECLIYSPPLIKSEQSLGVSVQSIRASGTSTQMRVLVSHGPSDAAVKLAAFPLAAGQELSAADIFVYTDADYPTAGVAPTVAQGVYDHLSGELSARDYAGHVSAISAAQLPDVLKEVSKAKDRSLVMMTGVMPDTVFGTKLDLVSPWVQAGGTLAWAGGAMGYWSGTKGQALASANIVGESGTMRLLGSGVIQYPTSFGREGTTRSDWASALDVAYKFTGVGVLRNAVASKGGFAFGWYSGLFSSISFLPHGSGGYIIFGGEVSDEASIAVDLTKILMSHATSSAGIVAARLVTLTSTSSSTSLDWSLPFNLPNGKIVVIAFDPNPDGVFFASETVPVSAN